jgi:hypothetical protein
MALNKALMNALNKQIGILTRIGATLPLRATPEGGRIAIINLKAGQEPPSLSDDDANYLKNITLIYVANGADYE